MKQYQCQACGKWGLRFATQNKTNYSCVYCGKHTPNTSVQVRDIKPKIMKPMTKSRKWKSQWLNYHWEQAYIFTQGDEYEKKQAADNVVHLLRTKKELAELILEADARIAFKEKRIGITLTE